MTNENTTKQQHYSGMPSERRRQWDALDVEWREALEAAAVGCDTSGGARPGQPCEVGNITVVPKSDSYWVMDAARYDRLMGLYQRRVVEARPAGLIGSLNALIRNRRPCDPNYLPEFLVEAVEVLCAGLLGEGFGPVAPCFDEFDEAAEACRGKWYVFDGDAYKRFSVIISSVSPKSMRSGQT